jgi:hypothetical protein
MKLVLPLILCLLPFSQEARPGLLRSFWKLSRPEKGWALTHPFQAKRAFSVTQHVRQTTDSLFRLQIPDTFRHGGRIDAFRHAYWMAAMTRDTGERASRKLGKCHEKGNKIQYLRGRSEDGFLQDATACEMDLYNNEAGIRLALYHGKASRNELITLCLDAIDAGLMKILSINASGEYCDCHGNPVVTLRRGKDKWRLPICLISSQ